MLATGRDLKNVDQREEVGAGWAARAGDGRRASVPAPVCVTGTCATSSERLDDVLQIDGGDYHFCARRSSGTVWCWGDDGHLQMGNHVAHDDPGGLDAEATTGYATDWDDTGNDAMEVTTGEAHTCVLRANGTTLCGGRNTAHQLDIAFP